ESASLDRYAPTSTITSPASGFTATSGAAATITGTASDTNAAVSGKVGGVEVSVDGGSTWHPAQGRENWSYTWTPGPAGPTVIKSRAVDDSGNLEDPATSASVTAAGISATVNAETPASCPCSIWNRSVTPSIPAANDTNAVELGVRFHADSNGYITGIRFYKDATNSGVHVARLWSDSGTMLAAATFTAETTSGWQEVSLPTPVAIIAGTNYVASYHTNNGHYAVDY